MSRKRSWGWARRTARRYRAYYAAGRKGSSRPPLPPISRAVEALTTTRRAAGSVRSHTAIPNFAAAGGATLELIE